MSHLLASTVVAVPVWCLALGAWLAMLFRGAWGTRRSVAFALVLLITSLVARAAGGPYTLLVGTITTCCAIAVLGALLPPVVKAARLDQRNALTTAYTVALGCGSAAGALLTPWLAPHSWRIGTMSWAIVAACALLAWQTSDPPRDAGSAGSTAPRRSARRARLTRPRAVWALTAYLGLLSGFTFAIMGWLPSLLRATPGIAPSSIPWLYAMAMTIAVPLVLWVPTWAGWLRRQSLLAILLAAPAVFGTAGLLLAPAAAPWVWVAGIGLGMPSIVLALTLIERRAADVASAAALSFRVQGVGYAIAGATTLGVGQLHALTASWSWPLVALLLVLGACAAAGAVAGRPTTIGLACTPH